MQLRDELTVLAIGGLIVLGSQAGYHLIEYVDPLKVSIAVTLNLLILVPYYLRSRVGARRSLRPRLRGRHIKRGAGAE
ncbi:hypothetical protein ACRYCC_02265 [Actinomadura scrupuli]|uniref:hypothetical protein n=1 Tax=Actinomadura scrupuli TaxID=559629 RepID=UPI003D97D25D